MKPSQAHLAAMNARTSTLAKQWLRESENLSPTNGVAIDHFAITTAALHHALGLMLDRANDAAQDSIE